MTSSLPAVRLLVVMPAWNEEECVAATVREVLAAQPSADIVVVDDGSLDRTAARAREAGATVLVLPFNLGVGGAMRAGFKYAARHGYDAAIQVDSDGQHDPSEIAGIIGRLDLGRPDTPSDATDVVIGARFADKGAYQVRGPRRWAMVLLSKVLSRMSKTRLTDITSGFRAANRRTIELYARHYPAEYLGDTVESLVIVLRSGLRVSQVPVHMRPRQGGTPSNAPFSAAVYLMRALLALLLARIRRWPRIVPSDEPVLVERS